MIKTKEQIGVLILAAGNSSRMGSHKFLLKYDEKRCFLQKIIENYQDFGCSKIKVVLNKEGGKLLSERKMQAIDKKHIVINSIEYSERFYSVKLGIAALNKASMIFVHHVDNPFIDFKVLNSLIEHKNEGDYIVPTYEGKGGHPILIKKKIIEAVQRTNEYDMHFKNFLNHFSRKNVAVNTNNVLININTIDEYDRFFTNK